MNKELKQRWVTALRSGDYADDGRTYYNHEPSRLDTTLEVMTELTALGCVRLNDRACSILNNRQKNIRFEFGQMVSLARLNDEGFSFSVITDIIEECL